MIFYDFIDFSDFLWIGVDFMDSLGPGSGGIWRHLAGFCDGVWTLLLVCKIRSSDDHKDLWFLAWFSMVLLVCKIRSSDDHKDLWCLAWFSIDFIDLR